MAHFAKIENDKVVWVVVAEQDFIDRQPGEWVQTSYNTYGGVHTMGKTPLRKNFAGLNYIYDRVRDAFYSPQPYPSWLLNETTCEWNAPTSMPDDGKGYIWDEENTSWKIE